MNDLKYKLIFSDYDGTLTIGETVPEETAAAIADFRAAGGRFVLCSGRSPASAYGRMQENHIECDAIIASQGSVIRIGDREVLHEGLDAGQLARISDGIEETFHRDLITFCENRLYYTGESRPCMAYVKWAPEKEKIKLEHIRELSGMYPDSRFDKLLVAKEPDENMDAIYDYLRSHFGDEIVANSGSGITLSIISAKHTKSDACRMVAEALGIREAEAVTVGDSTNDIPLMTFGLGLAVGNAVPELKIAAKHVIEDIHDRPVEKMIRRLIAGREPYIA